MCRLRCDRLLRTEKVLARMVPPRKNARTLLAMAQLVKDRKRNLRRLFETQRQLELAAAQWIEHRRLDSSPQRRWKKLGRDSKAPTPGPLHSEARLPHVHACQIPMRPSEF